VRLSNQAVRSFFLLILAILAIEMIVRGIRGA
jgi:small neutral amino acid transporter SnatA (MarC family)